MGSKPDFTPRRGHPRALVACCQKPTPSISCTADDLRISALSTSAEKTALSHREILEASPALTGGSMKAAVVGENALEIREVAQPQPKPSEVLVRVRAIGMNRAELPGSFGSGHTRVTGSIPGLEFAGEVVECGPEVKGVKPGDRVMCAGAGGYAEYAVADYGRTSPIPANNMSWEQAATYPVALGTMHDAIVTNARLQRGETVIIQGASSGVGLMGLQITKLKGAKLVIGTSTNDARRARLKEFGADLVVDPGKTDWSQEGLKATGGKGAEVIIDMVSGPALNENMKAAAVLGRIVNVGRLGGGRVEFDCNT